MQHTARAQSELGRSLYTPAQRARRDASRWTLVQGILAPLQFLVFLISAWLVIQFLLTGEYFLAASLSVLAKTLVLYLIMVTGAYWEKDVFGQWLFAEPFFWEDVVSMLVIGLHTAYVVMFVGGIGTPAAQMYVALAAYVSYVVNAAQFFYKFRQARRAQSAAPVGAAA